MHELMKKTTSKLDTALQKLHCFSVCSLLSYLYVGFIDVFEINSPFIVTHNKCIVNVTQNVMVC